MQAPIVTPRGCQIAQQKPLQPIEPWISTATAPHLLSAPHPSTAVPPLLALPPELRLEIYDHALSATHVTLRRPWAYRDFTLRNPQAVLQICRTIRHEILPVFYQTLTFACLEGFSEQRLLAWLTAIGPKAVGNLRRLQFCCNNLCAVYGQRGDTDYCHRDATLDLSHPQPRYEVKMFRPDNVWKALVRSDSDSEGYRTADNISFCSNDGTECMSYTIDLFNAASSDLQWDGAKPIVTAEYLLGLWRALSADNGVDLYE